MRAHLLGCFQLCLQSSNALPCLAGIVAQALTLRVDSRYLGLQSWQQQAETAADCESKHTCTCVWLLHTQSLMQSQLHSQKLWHGTLSLATRDHRLQGNSIQTLHSVVWCECATHLQTRDRLAGAPQLLSQCCFVSFQTGDAKHERLNACLQPPKNHPHHNTTLLLVRVRRQQRSDAATMFVMLSCSAFQARSRTIA